MAALVRLFRRGVQEAADEHAEQEVTHRGERYENEHLNHNLFIGRTLSALEPKGKFRIESEQGAQ